MRRLSLPLLATVASVASASAQSSPAAPRVAPPAEQIAAAVTPLPQPMREGATVLGYSPDRKLVTLREGTNGMICLASDPAGDRFHVACYHKGMEPFMARGRALRAEGVKGEAVDTVRYAEVKAGKLAMPSHPSALYSLTGPPGSFDPANGEVKGARSLYVIYIPFATAESTGIQATPVAGKPWLMSSGTPKAHIMFVPEM
ncbi:MAG: hypothetical protein M3373_05060 [Gemmatimonadota bacterium]|nr:hypothetical protein [Gemmatimonadota bacterium]